MREERQQPQDAGRDAEQENTHRVNSAAELTAIKRRLDVLAVKRFSLAKAMLLLHNVGDPRFQQKQNEFVRQLPHKYHSQGPRRNVVHLPGGGGPVPASPCRPQQ